MKIIIRAGGILRKGAEYDLVQDYLKRANGLARGCGFISVEDQGVDLSKCKTRTAETEQLLSFNAAPSDPIIILDERGKTLSSREMTQQITRWRDDGAKSLHILIGGADGFEPSALPKGAVKWSLGRATWPHKLVRVMIAEQVYRALSILSGSPYHRD